MVVRIASIDAAIMGIKGVLDVAGTENQRSREKS